MQAVVLIHKQPHARGERVSAGPGIEYTVGNDGLLYVCEAVRGGGRAKYRIASYPGVHPDHAAALLRSSNIVVAESYSGPVVDLGSVAAAAPPPVESVPKSEHDRIVARLTGEASELRTEVVRLRGEVQTLQAEAVGLRAGRAQRGPPPVVPQADAPPPLVDAAPKAPPPPPVVPQADAPPPPPSDAASPGDLAAAAGLSVAKLALKIANGDFDACLPELRAAEAGDKNRASALAAIDARTAALTAAPKS